MNLRLIRAKNIYLLKAMLLYRRAFPINERKPFTLMLKKQKEGKMEVMAVLLDRRFAGFAATVICGDLVLVDYFAIEPGMRGRGIGSAALSMIHDRYPGKRMFLEIEDPYIEADNREQRLKRLEFYRKNGLHEISLSVTVFKFAMIVLTWDEAVGFSEYKRLYRETFGIGVAQMVVKRS